MAKPDFLSRSNKYYQFLWLSSPQSQFPLFILIVELSYQTSIDCCLPFIRIHNWVDYLQIWILPSTSTVWHLHWMQSDDQMIIDIYSRWLPKIRSSELHSYYNSVTVVSDVVV